MLNSFTASGLANRAHLFVVSVFLWAGAALAGGTPSVQIMAPASVTGQEVPTLSSAGSSIQPVLIPVTLKDSAGNTVPSNGYFIGCSSWSASYQGPSLGQATSAFSSCPAGMTYSAAQGGMVWRPNTNMAGTWQITLAVRSASQQVISTTSLTATISNTNVAPTAGTITCVNALGATVSSVRGAIDDSFSALTCQVNGFVDQDTATAGDTPQVAISPNAASSTCISPTLAALTVTQNEDGTATIGGAIPPSTAQSCSVSLVVTDRAGLARPSYSKSVTFSPLSLRVSGPTVASGVAGQPITFSAPLVVSDAQNSASTFTSPQVTLSCLSYAVGSGARTAGCPAGLSITSNGVISWTPTTSPAQVGVYSIYFSAATATRAFQANTTVTVSAPAAAASVTSVSSFLASGSYHAGAAIDVEVAFSKAVVLTSPQQATLSMALDSSTSRSATYVSGSGSSVLRFSYVVQVGDQAAKLEVASPIVLTGAATIKDLAGISSSLSLPTGAAAGSLSSRKTIVVTTGSENVAVSFISPASGATVNLATASALSVSGTCSENGRSVQISGPSNMASRTATCAGNAWSSVVNLGYSGAPQGAVTLKAATSSIDGRGASSTVSFSNYSVAPRANITTPSLLASVTEASAAAFAVSGTCNAPGSIAISGAATASATCVKIGNAAPSFSASLDFSNAPNGYASVTTVMTDLGGNQSTPTTYSFTIKRDPRVAITSPAANAIVNTAASQTSATISGTCSNAGQTVGLYLNSATTPFANQACQTNNTWSLNLPFSRVPSGATTFSVTAKHLTATPSVVTLKYDQPPTVTASIDLATATAPYANFLFDCKATATASDTTTITAGITYSWTQDGAQIATTQTLPVTSAMITHSLACSATATDSYGQSATATSSSSTVDNGARCLDGTTIAGAVDAPAADGEPVVCKLTVAPWQGDLVLLPTFNQLLQLISSVVPAPPAAGAGDQSLIDEQSYFISALSAVLEQIYPAPAAPAQKWYLTSVGPVVCSQVPSTFSLDITIVPGWCFETTHYQTVYTNQSDCESAVNNDPRVGKVATADCHW